MFSAYNSIPNNPLKTPIIHPNNTPFLTPITAPRTINSPPPLIPPPTLVSPLPSIYTKLGGSQGLIPDIDPISPGIQTTPGVLTLTGPTTLVSGAGYSSVGTSSSRNIGITSQSFIPLDIDPISPGIQGSPGVLSITGPSQIAIPSVGTQGGFIGTNSVSRVPIVTGNTLSTVHKGASFKFGENHIIDADPITPGIQTNIGVITVAGPSTVISEEAITENLTTGFLTSRASNLF